MNYKAYPVGVHINENSVKVLGGIVKNDNGNLFQVQLYSGTEAYDFTGYTIINATIARPDETTLSDMWPVTEGSDEQESHTFLAIQDIDAKNGRITLKVGGDATAQVGLHRMAIEIYSDTVRVTTARINYVVVETLDDDEEANSILENSESYTALQSLITSCSSIISVEEERVNQEVTRAENEAAREASFTALRTELQSELEYARALFNEAIAAGQMEELKTYLEGYIDDRIGIIPTTESAAAWFAIADNQRVGAVVFDTVERLMYIGTGDGGYMPVITYKPYEAGTTAPTDTRSLWVDSSAGNVVKYYNGASWVETGAIAIFG